MKRRSFLRHLSHAAAVPGILGTTGFGLMNERNSLASLLSGAGVDNKVLVMIFLDGGNDGLNTVIPLDQLSNLNKARPHVMLPDQSLIHLPNTEVALHPALQGLSSLYKESRFQIIQNVGYPEPNASHFRSADIWMSASDATEHISSGWAARHINGIHPTYPTGFPNKKYTDPMGIEMGNGSSLLFQGHSATTSMVISNPDEFYKLIAKEEKTAAGGRIADNLNFIRLMEKQSQLYGAVVKEAATKVKTQKEFPESSLGQQLKIVSRLIAGGLTTPVYLVRLGSFDTHSAQVEEEDHTTGMHASLLKDLDDSIMAFMKDLEFQGTADRVLGMTFSEFGRRIASNASEGTDHGEAAPLFMFGNPVKGGLTGTNPVIPDQVVAKDNLPFQYDFRQVYASVLQQWLGASSKSTSNILFKDFDQIKIVG